jgi:glycosyltransferase involved in cell wall biosynthesis
MKKLSIITIVKDHKEGFLRTAESIATSKPDWCEWVVIDGASTDGTREAALALFSGKMDVFVSEPDKGIADAFNKGILQSHGKYVLFLNAGDSLSDPSMGVLCRMLASDDGAPVIVGRVRFGRRVIGKPVSLRQQMMRNHLPHQAMLIRRDLFHTRGLHDTDFKFAMDYEWTLRLADIWNDISFSNETVSDMEPGGVAIENFSKVFKEYEMARRKNGYVSVYHKIMYYIYVARMSATSLLRGK